MTHCPTTGKRAYSSEAAARRAMRRLSARLRTYRCAFCAHIHLSHEFRGKRTQVSNRPPGAKQ